MTLVLTLLECPANIHVCCPLWAVCMWHLSDWVGHLNTAYDIQLRRRRWRWSRMHKELPLSVGYSRLADTCLSGTCTPNRLPRPLHRDRLGCRTLWQWGPTRNCYRRHWWCTDTLCRRAKEWPYAIFHCFANYDDTYENKFQWCSIARWTDTW